MIGSGKAPTVAQQAAKVDPSTSTSTSTSTSSVAAGGNAKELSGTPAAQPGIFSLSTPSPDCRSSGDDDAAVPEWKIRCLCADRGAVSSVMIGGFGWCF